MVSDAYFSNIVSFIGGGSQSTRRKII